MQAEKCGTGLSSSYTESLVITSSSFHTNSQGLNVENGNVEIDDTEFINNGDNGGPQGGGILISNSHVWMHNVIIEGNKAGQGSAFLV